MPSPSSKFTKRLNSIFTASGMEELYCLSRATDVKQKQGESLLVSEPGFRPGHCL